MALDGQILDANFSGLINPEIWAADPMLRSPNGVIGLFDTQSAVSYPLQSAPDATHQLIYNRVSNPAVASLQFGTTDAVQALDPTWSAEEGALVFTRSAGSLIRGILDADFQFVSDGFLITLWFKPGAAFSTGNVNGFLGRHTGVAATSGFILYNNGTTLNAQVLNGSTFITATSASGTFSPSGNIQVGISWQPSGASGTVKAYINGNEVASTVAGFGTLNTGDKLSIGTSAYPIDMFFKRLFVENLAVSGNDPAKRVELEFAEVSQILN